nr:hypothetical protein CFP56_24806 [Quercus suber]
MTTRFSKQKLAEAQKKKAKGGLVSYLLSKKHSKMGDISKEDPVITPSPTNSPAKRPASPTSSLEDDVNVATLKAYEALSVDDLSPLMAKSSSKVMSSHIQKLVQVATFEPMIKSLFAKNEMFENKVAILTVEAKNDRERVVALEKRLQVENDFCKLKDK